MYEDVFIMLNKRLLYARNTDVVTHRRFLYAKQNVSNNIHRRRFVSFAFVYINMHINYEIGRPPLQEQRARSRQDDRQDLLNLGLLGAPSRTTGCKEHVRRLLQGSMLVAHLALAGQMADRGLGWCQVSQGLVAVQGGTYQ